MEGKKIAAYAAGALVCVGGGMLIEHYGNVVDKSLNFLKKGEKEEVASPAQAQAQVQNQEPVVVAKPQQNQQKA